MEFPASPRIFQSIGSKHSFVAIDTLGQVSTGRGCEAREPSSSSPIHNRRREARQTGGVLPLGIIQTMALTYVLARQAHSWPLRHGALRAAMVRHSRQRSSHGSDPFCDSPFELDVIKSTLDHKPRLAPRVEQARWDFVLPDQARRMISEGVFRGGSIENLYRWFLNERELAATVLRWANTPLYNLGRPCKDLAEAARVIDPADLARLALMAHFQQSCFDCDRVPGLASTSMWRHGVAVGNVAAMIARTCGVEESGDAMLAGVMHDIGILVSAALHPSECTGLVEDVDQLSALHEVEYDAFGWNHTDLGYHVLREWQLPLSVQLSAKLHHASESEILATGDPIVSCVVIANFLCSRNGWGNFDVHNLATPSDGIFAHLDIGPDMLMVIWHQLRETLKQATVMLE